MVSHFDSCEARQFLEFVADLSCSSTSWISQSHYLCCLRKIIDSTNSIEVKPSDALAHFIYTQILRIHIARYTENDFSLLRSRIGELHPVHRASLGSLCRHLYYVADHSDKNGMSVPVLAGRFCYPVLRVKPEHQGEFHKAHCIDFVSPLRTDSLRAPGFGGSHSIFTCFVSRQPFSVPTRSPAP